MHFSPRRLLLQKVKRNRLFHIQRGSHVRLPSFHLLTNISMNSQEISYIQKIRRNDILVTPLIITDTGLKVPPVFTNIDNERIDSIHVYKKTTEDHQINQWYIPGRFDKTPNGIGVIVGSETNLYCFDIDLKHIQSDEKRIQIVDTLWKSLKEINHNLYNKLIPTGIKTRSGGRHYYFKLGFEYSFTSNNPPLLVLDNKTIIELRTDGYVATYPSEGYDLLPTTDINFWDNLPVLSDIEFYDLRAVCKQISDTKIKKKKIAELQKLSPIEAFNAQTKLEDLLTSLFDYTILYHNDTDTKLKVLHPNNPTQPHSGYIYKDVDPPFYYEHSQNGSFGEYLGKPLFAHQLYAISKNISPYDNKTINRLLFTEEYGSMWNSVAQKHDYTKLLFTEFCAQHEVYYDSFSNAIRYGSGLYIDDALVAKSYEFYKMNNVILNQFELKQLWLNTANFVQKNPIYDYFKKCYDNYTGVDEFALLMHYMNFKDKERFEPFVRKYLYQIPAQALYSKDNRIAGLQSDLILYLYSTEHGLGKSRFFSEFLFQNLDLYTTTAFAKDIKEQRIQFANNIMICDDEGFVVGKKEIEHLKTMVSSRRMDTTLKYQNYEHQMARRAVFSITGNRRELINDDFNRRIIALEVQYIDVESLLEDVDIDNLWGQLAHEYENNPSYLTSADIKELNQATEEYKRYNRAVEILQEFFEPYENIVPALIKQLPIEHRCLKRNDIIRLVEIVYPRVQLPGYDISDAIKKLGWKTNVIRYGNHTERVYILKPATKLMTLIRTTDSYKLIKNK